MHTLDVAFALSPSLVHFLSPFDRVLGALLSLRENERKELDWAGLAMVSLSLSLHVTRPVVILLQ